MNPITFNFTGAIQTYTVPTTGTYDLSGFGAGGGSADTGGQNQTAGGSGAEIGGTFNLTQGQQLQIVVGGAGAAGNNGGGGGFTEVLVNSGAGGAFVPLLIAGGGGGGGTFGTGGGNATVTAPSTPPGAGGAGGGNNGGGGGAGGTGNGGSGTLGPAATGGSTGPSYAGGRGIGSGNGGFGGGGGGDVGGGGGGGSTGGNGGSTNGGSGFGGFGGTSYLSNTGTLNAAETQAGAGTNTGAGSARIAFVPAAPAQTTTPTTTPAPCFVTGTRLRVLRPREGGVGFAQQDVPVERLVVGDLAATIAGRARPIRWIGRRSYPGLTAPEHDRPVRIKADAIADGMPSRDLLLSPDHCLWLDDVLAPVGHLVNGISITRGEVIPNLTYWHVELDAHDVLLAENTPAESFLAAPGVRAGFDGVQALDAGSKVVPLAPRAGQGPKLADLRGGLALRGLGMGDGVSTTPGAVRAWLDVCAVRADGALRVAGWVHDAAHPDAPVCLDILVDGAVVAFAVADQPRADLAAAGLGRGRHGFDLGVAVRLAEGVAHVVEVRRSCDGVRVAAKAVDAAGAWTALLAA